MNVGESPRTHGAPADGDRTPVAANEDEVARPHAERGTAPSVRYTALIAGYTGAVGGALVRELASRAEWRYSAWRDAHPLPACPA